MSNGARTSVRLNVCKSKDEVFICVVILKFKRAEARAPFSLATPSIQKILPARSVHSIRFHFLKINARPTYVSTFENFCLGDLRVVTLLSSCRGAHECIAQGATGNASRRCHGHQWQRHIFHGRSCPASGSCSNEIPAPNGEWKPVSSDLYHTNANIVSATLPLREKTMLFRVKTKTSLFAQRHRPARRRCRTPRPIVQRLNLPGILDGGLFFDMVRGV